LALSPVHAEFARRRKFARGARDWLTMGTMTFGGEGKFGYLGHTGVDDARRQIDLCLDVGINLIDTADVYSAGRSEEILGEAVKTRPRLTPSEVVSCY
jgi:aryl-alcohol dehydrogenase-like predicted oxidoreductase